MSKIPAHAERVFKGEIFDVYQWQQTLFNGATATFERLRRPDTVVVLPMQGDMVFYAEQEQPGSGPYLSLFGGRAERDEQPLVAAKRELLEETGFVSEDWHPLFTKTISGKIDWSIHYFVARNCTKMQEPTLDGGEKIIVKSTSLEDFMANVVTHPTFSEAEIRERLYSAFNPAAANHFIAQLKA